MDNVTYNTISPMGMALLMEDNNRDALKYFNEIHIGHRYMQALPAYAPFDWVTDLAITHTNITEVDSFERLEHFTNLQTLDLSFTNIPQIPQQIGCIEGLRVLLLRGCHELEHLPDTMALLKNLEVLELSGCYTLKNIPDCIGSLKNLNILKLIDCDSLTGLPASFSELNVRELDLTGCEGFKKLPDCVVEMKSLVKLTLERMPKIKTLPYTIKQLSNLRELSLYNCHKLESLPIDALGELYNLRKLNISMCGKLNRAEVKVKLERMLPNVEVKVD